MSEAESRAPNAMAGRIKGPQDFYGGLALMGIALFALWAARDLQGTSGFSFGPGTVPRMAGIMLLLMGAGVAASGFFTTGAPLQRFSIRGPLFVTLAILSFSVTIRPLGLVVSALASFFIAAMATPETNWKETIIVGVLLTAGCSLLFPYALGLPLELYPPILR